MNIKGGKVIASGGFGCIFKPSLKCKDGEQKPDNISKLMSVKHANDEYNKIQTFRHVLQHIPNYQNYFLVEGFSICEPEKLTKDDLVKFNTKCKTLKKRGVTSKNINKNLDKLASINMPYGGIDITKYMEIYQDGKHIIHLNNSLINLLVEGIIPMNKLNCYHGDIKDGNILVNVENGIMNGRLIDWGLAFKHKYSKNSIPAKLYRRPFQFNVPFSIIIFNKEFNKQYKYFLHINPNPLFFQIREFVMNYISIWNDIRGTGHFNAINSINDKLVVNDLPSVETTIKNNLIEYDVTYYYIIEYISKVLEKYTIDNIFMMDDYFNNIFLKQIDVWGFIMVYISLYEELYLKYNDLTEYQSKFMEQIKYIIIHFLYENPINEININELVMELQKINDICQHFDTDINVPSLKHDYLRYLKTIANKKNKKTRKQKKQKKQENIK
jgi:hypothetical protein